MTSTETTRSPNFEASRELVSNAWYYASYMRAQIDEIDALVMTEAFDLAAVSEDCVEQLRKAHAALTELLANIDPDD